LEEKFKFNSQPNANKNGKRELWMTRSILDSQKALDKLITNTFNETGFFFER
jgi:hypothetical protein